MIAELKVYDRKRLYRMNLCSLFLKSVSKISFSCEKMYQCYVIFQRSCQTAVTDDQKIDGIFFLKVI